ncbi:hypothetical protein EOPP23_17835 [Endozoicomonas sp. OPT23]|uniref:PqiC family protein n=1 Tax=Endozoicomonas sp. OPT23 TaxID=2072845 RepID=UPI00129AB3AC|nr:ABC-type transport auxiliary lipoprotein family protein [Endozoicomonas sp. OPT23]MRI34841.1 hypothetical protein [Endozoicomonas sp. OPT23]
MKLVYSAFLHSAFLHSALLTVSLILTGCGTTNQTPTRLYLLPIQNSNSTDNAQRPLIVVKTVQLPDHLNDQSLVYQVSDSRIVQAKKHLWASDIAAQITQRVVVELKTSQIHYRPVHPKPSKQSEVLAEVTILLNRFNGSYTGNAEVSGNWEINFHSKKPPIIESFNITVPLKDDGYPALVKALSEGVNEMTSGIASALK